MRMCVYSALFAAGLFGDAAPVGCGCASRPLSKDEQSKLTEAFRVADEDLPKVENGLARIEAKPSPEALPELRTLSDEFEKVHKGISPVEHFGKNPIRRSLTTEQETRLAKEQKRYAALPARFRKVLSKCGVTLLSDEEQRTLDDVLREANERLSQLERALVPLEKEKWSDAALPEFRRLYDEQREVVKLLGKVTGLLRVPACARLSEEQYARLGATSRKSSELHARLMEVAKK
jgi:hypothetical protein